MGHGLFAGAAGRGGRSGLFAQALDGVGVQPFGVHARAGELVAHGFGEGGGLVSLGVGGGKPQYAHEDGGDEDQGFDDLFHDISPIWRLSGKRL